MSRNRLGSTFRKLMLFGRPLVERRGNTVTAVNWQWQ